MQTVHVEPLIAAGEFIRTDSWKRVQADIAAGVLSVVWPPGGSGFSIRPVRMGNGVVPIKAAMIASLRARGWVSEALVELQSLKTPGPLDAMLETTDGRYALEWETGNIASSHRALNKMALLVMRGSLAGGTLIVPSRRLYRWLTDRVGNFEELRPYLDLWRALPVRNGVLEVRVVEHDSEDPTVPRIEKGTDGRALR